MAGRNPFAGQRRLRWLPILALPLTLLAPEAVRAQEPGAVAPEVTEAADAREAAVHGVLFYSPTCPHCRDVMTQGLPPIVERFAGGLEIIGVNTASSGGQALYRAAIEALAIPPERVGVPTLVVGSRVLVGSYEIPTLLPGIVEDGLAAGGIDWPPVPLIRRALAAQGLLPPESAEPVDVESAAEPRATDEPAQAAAAEDATMEAAAAEDEPATEEMEPAEAATDPESDSEVDAAVARQVAPEPTSEAAPAPTPDPDPVLSTEAASESGPGPGAEADAAVADSILAGAMTGGGRSDLVHRLTVGERLMLDPAGNAAALAVLVLMLAALGLVALDRAGRVRVPAPPVWLVPALAVVGLVVAGYLAYIEATGAEAVCGPVGHCNTVQQSRFARILGVPVGVLGVVGYAVFLVAWLAGRNASMSLAGRARELLWWLALGGTLFSVYLTFLEPFVIGASCAWCLTSAAATTGVLLAATGWRRTVGVSPTARHSVSH